MAIAPDLVKETYRVILGREVESESLATQIASRYDTRSHLLHDLLRSDEFMQVAGPHLQHYAIPAASDVQLFAAFGRYSGPGRSGFVTDFLGNRTDVNFISSIKGLDGVVEGYPLPRGNFHGDLTEWIGTLMSVLDAQEALTVMELGAGWAPWLVVSSAAARIHKIKQVRLIGVEGSSAHAAYMRQHFANNDIDPSHHLLLHGIAGTYDGEADFPVAQDPAADWGQAALFESSDKIKDYRGFTIRETERVPVYCVSSLLANETVVNLIHVDIQGSEVEVLGAGIDVLNKKAKALVVGTHSRTIEDQLSRLLTDSGWFLCREQASQYALGQVSVVYAADGCQFWRNSNFFEFP